MLGEVAKRVVNAVVLLLAGVTFFQVPIGGKTPAQHVVAIFSTAPAREAAGAAAGAGRKIVSGVTELHAPPKPQPAQPSQEELEPAD